LGASPHTPGGNPHTPLADGSVTGVEGGPPLADAPNVLRMGVGGGYPLADAPNVLRMGVEGGYPLAVIFDEVHYINDAERGSVWEQAILLLPPQVQLIMLSATIDRAEDFAGWIETEKAKQWLGGIPPHPPSGESITQGSIDNTLARESGRGGGGSGGRRAPCVYLCSTSLRIVPLTHYMWLSTNDGAIKKAAVTNAPYEKKLEELRKTPIVIATSDGAFREDNYYKIKDTLDYLYKNKAGFVKRQFVLNDLLHYLKGKEMLPAICFVFSRKQVEQAAREINFSLFDVDSDNWSYGAVEKECRHILQSKFKNYQEYLDLPEYQNIIQLLEKGIAIHHAGILPVLREMVELLFEKGFIRLLLATETFAVGLNMPTKTVIFLGLSKFNGSSMRQLYPHEYTQMAGRAGRRGKDTVGHVIHCVNLFELPSASEYKHLLTGPPQTLVSKFKFSFSMALSMLEAKQDMHEFMTQSLLSVDLRREIKGYDMEAEKVQEIFMKKQELLQLGRTPPEILLIYKTIFDKLPHMVNSARKRARQDLNGMEATYKFLLQDLTKYEALETVKSQLAQLQREKSNTESYVENNLNTLLTILEHNCFIYNATAKEAAESQSDMLVTQKGQVAAKLQEVHPLAMADLYFKTEQFAGLSSAELAGLFSCFYPLSVSDDLKVHNPPNTTLYKILLTDLQRYKESEEAGYLNTGAQYELSYDLLPLVEKWCYAETEIDCKIIIQGMKEQTGTFLGEFIKALLKVNAIASEFEQVCELTQNIALLEKIREIPRLTLKYIATNQSLYL
jgi:superfamily II RNA helicase